MKEVNYNNFWLRMAFAFFGSTYILFFARDLNLGRVLRSPATYFVFVISFSIAALMIYAVHRATVFLDTKYPWRSGLWGRAFFQIILGIITPCLIDIILISIYFIFLDQDITSNGFLQVDFPLILVFIIIVNLYYAIHYLFIEGTVSGDINRSSPEQKVNDPESKNAEAGREFSNVPNGLEGTFSVRHKKTLKVINIADVIYFCRVGKKVSFATFDREVYQSTISISDLSASYSKDGFIQINRGMLIRCAIIDGYTMGYRKNTLQIVIKPIYEDFIQVGSAHFQVTKDYISGVNNIFLPLKSKV